MQTPNTRKKAFTLVELIIVITILAILGTIAYISFQGFVKDARDGNRIASIKNIEKSVEISFTESGKYPQPDLKTGQTLLQTGALSISGSMVEYSYLGEIGTILTRQLRITKTPTDPLSGDKYTYATTQDGKKYQIASILENPTSYKNTNKLVNQVNADNGYVAKVSGNHTDIVIKEVSNGKFITVVPSIIFDGSGSNILNQSGTLLIVNNKGNLPYSPNKSTSLNNTTTAEQVIREIRNNNQATTVTLQIPNGVTLDGSGILNEWWNPSINKENTNWKLYSTGTILASLGAIDPVTGGADYTKLTDVLNGRSVSNATTTQTTTTTSSSYDVGNSLRFNGSSYLSRIFSPGGSRQKMTISMWVKRSSLSLSSNKYMDLFCAGTNAGGVDNCLRFTGTSGTDVGDKIQFFDGATGYGWNTQGVFRDVSNWYNIVLSIDTTQTGSTDRTVLYIDGKKITNLTTESYNGQPSQNTTLQAFGNNVIHTIGSFSNPISNYFDGYISDVYYIDGEQLPSTSFGQFDTNGRWIPKSYIGNYGTNGFHLDFSSGATNSTGIGKDRSGKDNDWTPNGFTTQDQTLDSPTNNFATLNPLSATNSSTLSNGNLKWLYTSGTYGRKDATLSFNAETQNIRFEAKFIQKGVHSGGVGVGIIRSNVEFPNSDLNNQYTYRFYNGQLYGDGTYVSKPGSSTMEVGDILTIIIENGSLFFYKNGIKLDGGLENGAWKTGLVGIWFPTIDRDSQTTAVVEMNFGQSNWSSNITTTSLGLSTKNITYPIENPKQYFDIKLWSGNGNGTTGTQSITGLTFQPDLVWIKTNSNADQHNLYDSVRGVTNYLSTSSTIKQQTSYTNGLSGFLSNGYTLGSDPSGYVNYAGRTYVSWNWKESQSSGFDIVKYTGNGSLCRNVSHSLGSIPRFMITKNITDDNTNWYVEHRSTYEHYSGQYWLLLNSTNSYFNAGSQAPDNSNPLSCGLSTSASFNVGYNSATSGYGMSVPVVGGSNWSAQSTNISGKEYITYLWSEIPGYSKFGSYTGNGNADGPFVYTGFKPRYILFKNISTSMSWHVYDTDRNTYNPNIKILFPNSTLEEYNVSGDAIDILSNGFKFRGNLNENVNGQIYIYAAFAELPFK